ncbi:hypothetical protein [Sphaerisporangium aureirubrum]|uniref:Uncharacterized protein n=1 Tax=Sphaerisporangium aureirubrum TaxID=1544736 RepID=A0ABW1NDK4_9ACTN
MNWDPRAELLKKADALDHMQRELPERGASLLATVASHLRAAADIYATDPTLINCPAGRERDLNLLAELARQIAALVRTAATGRSPERWPIENRWAEAEAAAARLPVILERARAAARPDHATPEGSHAISLLRLNAATGRIHRLADDLRAALGAALALPHPTPEAIELAELADRITTHITALQDRCTQSEAPA